MQVYLADNRSTLAENLFHGFGFGRMCVERTPRPCAGEPWAFDNGAFPDLKSGRHPDYKRFSERLARIVERIRAGSLAPPTFCVCPDLIGAGAKGLDYSLRWLDRLEETYQDVWPKLNWYLAVQDGFDPIRTGKKLSRFSGLFIAGSDSFKRDHLSVWQSLGKSCGKPVHYARCSTPAHWVHAARHQVDSLDTARPLTRKEYLFQFLSFWLMRGEGE